MVRRELLDPRSCCTQYENARKLVVRIYHLLNAGSDCAEPLAGLNSLSQKRLCVSQIEDAAELIDPETFAYEVLADLIPTPTDLTHAEMLELVEKLLADASQDSIQHGHWSRCLEANTGDRRLSLLLQSPELYFRDGVSRKLTAQEILDIALAAGGKSTR